MVFFDSNILIYAIDRGDTAKHAIAEEWTQRLLSCDGSCMISTQTMNEFCCVLLRKLKVQPTDVRALQEELRALPHVQVDAGIITRAIEIQALYKVQFFDAQVIAAAEHAGCDEILSEDLNDGQYYCGIKAVNPFAK